MTTAPGPTLVDDVLGDDWVARTIPLTPDAGGGAVATLVHRRDAGTRNRAVLYLHGFTDYFFQTAHADAWRAQGYDFYALELRDYGRSIRPGRMPAWVTDLRTYDEELDAAVDILRGEQGHAEVVLLGHSTGGLVASLYANDHPGRVDALVLNSPWFDLNSSWFDRVIGTRIIDVLGRFAPHVPVGTLGDAYGRSLHSSTGGDYDYDLAWKPLEGFPVHAGWLRAVRRGHGHIKKGLSIRVPVLVCTSARSGDHKTPTADELANTDCVLDVRHIRSRAAGIGSDVTVLRVPGGRHDLALSREPARSRFEYLVFDWLGRRMP
ncbi:MAG: alpha/beta hydrolase [Actinomycetales bacterium]|nr:alpha/beta hydrolase [Actinomycetales bacterium]